MTIFTTSQGSTEQVTVSCVLNNPPNASITPNWVNSNRTVVSETQFLTLSATLFPTSTEFFCVVQLTNTPTLDTVFNYVVLIPAVVISDTCNLTNPINGSVSVDCSDQLATIATSINSIDLSVNALLSTLDTILELTNGSTLNEDTIVELTINTLTIAGSALIASPIETTENAVIDILDELIDVFSKLETIINNTFSIEGDGFMVQSQVIQNTGFISIPVLNSSETVNINISQSIIGINPRVTFISSNVALGRSVTAGVSAIGVIRSSVLSIGIQGVTRDTVLDPPLELEFTLPDSIDNATSQAVCVFFNEVTQLWDTTGVETVVTNGRILCRTSHLTSFAVLEMLLRTENIALRVIAYILLALSLIALCISLVLFILSWRRFFDVEMNRMFFNYALALLLGIATFIFGVNLGVLDNIFCIIVTLLMSYFWLAVFTWGLAIAILITYMVTFGLIKRRKIFWPLFAFAWVFPLPIVLITFIYGMVLGDYARRDEQCFLTLAYIWSLIGPIFVIIVLNSICYVIVIVRMIMVSVDKVNSSILKRALLSGVILLPVLGVPWIVILIDFIFAQYGITSAVFEWVFLILIGPSGIIFLIVFTLLNKTVQETLRGKICGRDIPAAMAATTVEGQVITNPMSHEFDKKPETGIELEKVYSKPRDIIYSNKSAGAGDDFDTEGTKDQEPTGEVFPENN